MPRAQEDEQVIELRGGVHIVNGSCHAMFGISLCFLCLLFFGPVLMAVPFLKIMAVKKR